MNLLALETSTSCLSVALWCDGASIERRETIPNGGSERLLPWVSDLLSEAGLSLGHLNGIAFGAGPGGFTGLRLACGITQGLAVGLDVPVVAVSTLEALAFNALRAYRQDEVGANAKADVASILACLDARMNEVYCAAYRVCVHGTELECLLTPWVAPPEQIMAHCAKTLADGQWWGCGDGFASYPSLLMNELPRRFPMIKPDAVAVAQLAVPRLLRGEGIGAEFATPLYVRDKVALTTAERLARGGVK